MDSNGGAVAYTAHDNNGVDYVMNGLVTPGSYHKIDAHTAIFSGTILPESSDVSVYLRDDDGAVVGGIVARIAWGWLYVERLWVDAAHRRRGHGARLLEAAEAHALERGCQGVHLDTFGDDALAFYRRCRYEVWATFDGRPPGGWQHFLRKRLPNG